MRWKISGANRQTGQDVEIIVEADSRDEAVKKAGLTGMIIADVVAIAEPVAQPVRIAPAHPVPPPPMQTTPVVPIMLVRPPRRWGVRSNIGLALTIIGLPLLCVGGVGVVPMTIGIVLMIQGD